ncbi:hypothetical protein RIF29_15056 [Crotalaria pallida]|uniref:Uncharacterized protein n=1 Tax=Crotalaria pallida TaxID=3830 RepID=A0AAN9FCH8_CROPI
MSVNSILVPFIVIVLLFPITYSEDEVIKEALARFMDQLAVGNPQRNACLSGTLDFTSLCKAKSLQILSLNKNKLHGLISNDIGACETLTCLFLSENNLSGDLPASLGRLSNLKWLHIKRKSPTVTVPTSGGGLAAGTTVVEERRCVAVFSFPFLSLYCFVILNQWWRSGVVLLRWASVWCYGGGIAAGHDGGRGAAVCCCVLLVFSLLHCSPLCLLF